MKLAARIMEHTWVYRLWQAPFSEKKFAPILAHNDLRRVRRVLDVGCGPATNTHYFTGADYLGVDSNAGCIEYARRHSSKNFLVSDVTALNAAPGEYYDFILLNSFLHHIDTPDACRILSHLGTLLTEDGHMHILDLVLPDPPSVARFLARMDRGDFPGPLEKWRQMIAPILDPVVFQPYSLDAFGVTLWHMFYWKGRARR